MAFKVCPKCKEVIDDTMACCPKCGFAVTQDGSSKKHEPWAESMYKKDYIKKVIVIVFISIFAVALISFFVVMMVDQNTSVDSNGVTQYEAKKLWEGLLLGSAIFEGACLIIGWVIGHSKVMIEDFEGYSVVAYKTLFSFYLYVDNKKVKAGPRFFENNASATLPNGRKVEVHLNSNVCLFTLLDEQGE